MKHKPFFEVNMKKEIKLKVLDDNHNGMGFAKINNIPIFIDKALRGDIVNVEIIKSSKKHYIGKIISFEKKVKREKILCPYYDVCGGCNLLHISYDEELEKKKEYLERLFKRKVKINGYDRYNYRNKVVLHVKKGKLGLYEENTNKIIPITKCLLLDENINKIISLFNSFDLSNLEEIIIRVSNDKILIKTTGKLNDDDLKVLIKYKNITSIYQDDHLIYGEKYLEYNFDDKKYLVNSDSFFQINSICAKNLYDRIKKYSETGDSLLDLYCGSLTIGIYLSDNFKKVLGVEINKDSYNCALENIKLNSIKNCNIVLGDSSLIKDKYDVVIVDPPRSGLSKKVIFNLEKMKVKKIIYVSCNPSTLKRDVELLKSYSIKEMEAFNMFPGTKHIECLCVLDIRR